MRFIFVRHGHFNNKVANRDLEPLLPHGREAARAAGEFLKERGIRPDVIFTTNTTRTKETGEIIQDVLGLEKALQVKGTGFAKGGKASLEDKLSEWLADLEPAPETVLFVGHGVSQRYCVDLLGNGPSIPRKSKSCVLVYDRRDGEWTCVDHFAGTP